MATRTMGIASREIVSLLKDGITSGCTDRQLLERFLAGRDEAAFRELQERHGPMVLATCRAVLKNEHDAADAFQATFLILIRKACSIHDGDALGSWLHTTARQVAIRASIKSRRMHHCETEAAAMRVSTMTRCETKPDASLIMDEESAIVHEEIARLPKRCAQVLILCELRKIPRAEAARQLGWSERTIRYELEKARQKIKTRLTRRGLSEPDGALGVVFLQARAAVPAALRRETVEAVQNILGRTVSTGVVAAATKSFSWGGMQIMLSEKVRFTAVALLGGGLLGGSLVAWTSSKMGELSTLVENQKLKAEADREGLETRVKELQEALSRSVSESKEYKTAIEGLRSPTEGRVGQAGRDFHPHGRHLQGRPRPGGQGPGREARGRGQEAR